MLFVSKPQLALKAACSIACFAHLGGEWCCELLPEGCRKQKSFESAFVLQVVSGGLGWAAFRRLSVGFLEVAEQIAKQIQNKFVNNSRSRKTCSAGRCRKVAGRVAGSGSKNPRVPEGARRLPEQLPEVTKKKNMCFGTDTNTKHPMGASPSGVGAPELLPEGCRKQTHVRK